MQKMALWHLYHTMLKTRCYEELVKKLWEEGLIQAEMHMGIGEEALMAAIFSQLNDKDAIAVDHRGTAPMLLKGVDPVSLLLEFMGHEKGLCKGKGGHMHLFSKKHLAASSGIVGAGGPNACGFGLAAKYQKTGGIAVGFFGEGAMNQGMLLESMNLAATLRLPVLFVCKDNGWAIATQSRKVTAGSLVERAKGLGLHVVEVNGLDSEETWQVCHEVIPKIRKKSEPYFLYAQVMHREGHFLGDPLLRFYHSPSKMIADTTGPLIKSVTKLKGAGIHKRAGSLITIFSLIAKFHQQLKDTKDPLLILFKKLKEDKDHIVKIEKEVEEEINQILAKTLAIYEGGMI